MIKIDPAKYLAKIDKTIAEHNIDLKMCAKKLKDIGYIQNNHLYDMLITSIDIHDIGKFNKYMRERFQAALNGKKIKFDSTKEVPHNILSFIIFVEQGYDNEEDFLKIAHSILNHHHFVDNIKYLADKNNDILINDALAEIGITNKISQRLLKKLSKPELIDNEEVILLKGFLHRCDYSASAGIEIEYPNNFLTKNLDNWYINNNYKLNPLQEYCKQNSNKNCITIAQTGMGKTEAGLFWIGNNKGFFMLPLRVSNNAIYERCKKQLFDNLDYDEKIGLLHSNSLDFYNQDTEDNDFIKHYDLTKNFALPLTISTVDQLFNLVYKYPGYEMKVAVLNNAHCVLDEFQSYDASLTAALIVGIEMLVKFGTKIHILTATLPPYLLDLLNKNINFKFNQFINDDIKRHNVKTIDKHLNAKDIICHFKKYGGKTLVICNTVTQAQQIFKDLKKSLENLNIKNVKLLHSRFTNGDRNEIEKDILKVGDTYYQEDIIYVTTQIVEASLDVDFDYLFTELCDLNSLFQRLGRCNRKGLKPFDEYNCFIYLEINPYLLDKIVDKALYELSYEAIKDVDGLLLESTKLELMNEYLTTRKLKEKNSLFLKKFNEKYDFFKNLSTYSFNKNESDLRNISTITFIPYSIYSENEDEIKQYIETMKNNKRKNKEFIDAKNKLNSFLVSVPANRYNNIGRECLELKVSQYESYIVRDCEYSKELGLIYSNSKINDCFL